MNTWIDWSAKEKWWNVAALVLRWWEGLFLLFYGPSLFRIIQSDYALFHFGFITFFFFYKSKSLKVKDKKLAYEYKLDVSWKL